MISIVIIQKSAEFLWVQIRVALFMGFYHGWDAVLKGSCRFRQ